MDTNTLLTIKLLQFGSKPGSPVRVMHPSLRQVETQLRVLRRTKRITYKQCKNPLRAKHIANLFDRERKVIQHYLNDLKTPLRDTIVAAMLKAGQKKSVLKRTLNAIRNLLRGAKAVEAI
jgi:hypothetical protein